MATKDQKSGLEEFEVSEIDMGDFEFASMSGRGALVKKADSDAEEEEYQKQQSKELKNIERMKDNAGEHRAIMQKIKAEEEEEKRIQAIKDRQRRAKERASVGLDPFGKDEPEEEFEIVPLDEDDEVEDVVEDVVEDAPEESEGKHSGGRPKGSKSEGLTENSSKQVPWAEDTLVSLRSMLLTREDLLKDYGFSEKEMIRIFEEKPKKFMKDIIDNNISNINNILTKKQQQPITKEQIAEMDYDDLEELLASLGPAASKFYPEDLSPEWWRFLHGEVPVATEAQKDKLAKLMAAGVRSKAKADIMNMWIQDRLDIPVDGVNRKDETKRLKKLLGQNIEENFRKGLDGVENIFVQDKTGKDLKEYLKKNDKLTDVDIFGMSKYYQTMLDHYSEYSDKLRENMRDVASGDFGAEDLKGEAVPSLLEDGENAGMESDVFDQIIGKSRGAAPSAE